MNQYARHVRRASPPPRAVRRAVSALILIGLAAAASADLPAIGSTEASSFTITRATWKENDFRVSGEGRAASTVAISDAVTGAAIASVVIDQDGRWEYRQRYGPPPCVVRATSDAVSLDRPVEHAETACGGTSVSLTGLDVSGPTSIDESGSASYTATATFSDGSARNVSASATWTEDSPTATIAGGVLSVGDVVGHQTITVRASYALGGVTESGSLAVTVQDVTGEPGGAAFVIKRATWRENDFRVAGEGRAASIVAIADAATGAAIAAVAINQDGRWEYRQRYGPPPCAVRATSDGVSLERAVDGAEPACGGGGTVTLAALGIAGPSSVNENSTASYVATATFSDGSTQNVTASAAWSEDSPDAAIDAGTLTAGEVGGDQAINISASYASGGVTRSAGLAVTIQDLTVTGSHAGRFMTYEGTRTCLTCHLAEAEQMHQSAHYQWQGDASETVGLNSLIAGKLGGINDFCIYPDINWLGKLTTVNGTVVDGGCAKCHTGLGLKPTPFATTEQLENIDCLVCHAPSYKRTLASIDGQFRFVADTASMSVSLLQAASDIRPPDSATCLTCHAKAGGGDNFKRGDLEMAQAHPSRDLDVHLASTAAGGAGLTCTSCHETAGHRVAGRGIDLRERDSAAVMACANCHGPAPHGSADINKHTARVNCTVCHIPSFARQTPTDMLRDWSQPGVLHPETGLYEPWMRQELQVIPTYAFFNGTSQFYQFGDPAVPGPNGRVLMAGPLGSINDPGAKIQAMKSHEGVQPIDPATRRLLPLKIGIFFQTGDLATAVAVGANAVGWPYEGHEFAATERQMGLYHQVAPKEAALSCATCHGGTRMDFASLGYTPRTTYNGKPLCASCHGLKTGTFTRIHQKHVTDRKYDCSTCHTFSKAQ